MDLTDSQQNNHKAWLGPLKLVCDGHSGRVENRIVGLLSFSKQGSQRMKINLAEENNLVGLFSTPPVGQF